MSLICDGSSEALWHCLSVYVIKMIRTKGGGSKTPIIDGVRTLWICSYRCECVEEVSEVCPVKRRHYSRIQHYQLKLSRSLTQTPHQNVP